MSIRELNAARTNWNRFDRVAIVSYFGAGIACAGLLLLGLSANAQDFVTPGPNTNLIGETLNPDQTHNIPDFGLKQQQEPSCIVSSSNNANIMCVFNDLRASDKPLVQGDSWIGYAMSNDKAETFNSGLTPGFKSHPNSLMMGFAADPTLVEIPGSYATLGDPTSVDSPGVAVLNYIGANRDSNVGVLVAQRFVENSQEDQLPWIPENTSHIIADGSSGRFIDKPHFIFIPDDLNSQTYREETIAVDGRDITVRTPSGTLLVAYAVFTGSSSVKVGVQGSIDGGVTWDHFTKLSESLNEVTGVSLTAIGQQVVATWRRKADNNNGDAIMRAFSKNGGKTWTKAEVVFNLCPFDQPATGVSFRTFTFPWSANDGNRFWIFSTERFFDAAGGVSTSCDAVADLPGVFDGIPRIVGMSSTDGINWFGDTANPARPFVVDANLDSSGIPLGSQVMPSSIGTKNRIDLTWYDTRREEPGLPLQGNGTPEAQIPLIYDYTSSDGQSLAKVLRKADVWMTRLTADCGNSDGCTPSIEPSVRVSRYPVAFAPSITAGEPYATAVEVEAHLPNHRLYASGTLAFTGDYIAIASPQFRKNTDGQWLQNSLPLQPSDLPSFTLNEDIFIAWNDNRDVRIDYTYLASQGDPEQVPYTPAGSAGGTTAFKVGEKNAGTSEPLVEITPEMRAVTESDDSTDPDTPPDDLLTCAVGNDFSRSRDSNVYGSVIADAATLEAPTLTKPLGTIQRMFPLILNNPDTTNDKDFCLVIKDQPVGGRASFFQLPAIPPFDSGPPPLTRLPVTVPAGGSAARAVFVFASATDIVRVDAYADDSTSELCADNLGSDSFSGTLQNRVFISDGSLFDSAYCEANPTGSACVDSSGQFASNAFQETHNISLASLNLQAPVIKASVTQEALNLQALNLQAPLLGALNLQALNLQAEVLAALNLQALNLQALNLQALNLQALNLQALNLQALNLQALNLQALNLQALNLQALNLQALNLQALNLQAPSLGDGTAEDPIIYPELKAAVVSDEVYYQDITYVVKTDANVTTTYTADIALDVDSLKTDPDDEDPVVQLIAWTPNSVNSTSADENGCGQPQSGFQAQVISSVTLDALNLQAVTLPQTISPDDQNPYVGEISFTGKPNQTIALTVRVWATGGTKLKLDENFNSWVACMNALEPGADSAACADAGIGQLISFGASAQGCETADTDGTLFGTDCLNNNFEKIFRDRQSPSVNPVNPPDGFTPAALPYELDATSSTLTVTWPITGSDTDASNVNFECTIDGVGGIYPTSISIMDDELFSATFSYDFSVGATPVSCDVSDGSGNVTTVSFDVEVFDVTDPVFTFVPPALSLEASGPAGTAVTIGDATATDVFAVTVTNDAPALFPLGETTVTWTATDANGNIATATQLITIADDTDPVFTFVPPAMSAESDGPGPLGTPVAIGQATATDLFAVTITNNAPALFPLGETTVTWTATDANGNTVTATQLVTVTDGTAPVFTFVPPAVSAESDGPAGTTVTIGDATATDLFAVTITNDAPALFPLGETTVTWTATDANGNTATATQLVTVTDGTAPVFTLVPPAVSAESDGPVGTAVAIGQATASDAFAVTITNDAPALFPLGETTVTWTATDANGNVATATQLITVTDGTAPVFTFVPPAVSAESDGPAGTTVTIGDATATDLFAVTITNDAPALFPLGSTTVTWIATDANGNVATATQLITISDDTDPVFTFVPPAVSAESDGPAGTTVTIGDATATDLFAVTITNDAPALFPLGSTTVTWIATDANGNTATATQLVTASDGTAPIFTFVPPAVSEESDGPAGTAVAIGQATATDLFAVTITNNAPALFPLGPTTVIWTATDANGNFSTATQLVTVTDSTAPVFTFVPLAVSAEETSPAGTAVAIGQATASDAFAVTITNDAPALFPLGETTVTWTATDANGNTATATQLVTVTDNTAPVVTAPDVELHADYVDPLDPDWASVTDFASNVTASDSVDGPITDISCSRDIPQTDPDLTATDFEFNDEPYSITCTAEDSSGNVGSASFLLTVHYLYDIDLVPPKKRARAGSTIPLDWQYLDWIGGAPVDSSAVDVRVSWARMTDASCSTQDLSIPEVSTGLGDDSGSSDFRYSASSDTWQFSLQTPDLAGYYRFTILPPGKGVAKAWTCVNLR